MLNFGIFNQQVRILLVSFASSFDAEVMLLIRQESFTITVSLALEMLDLRQHLDPASDL